MPCQAAASVATAQVSSLRLGERVGQATPGYLPAQGKFRAHSLPEEGMRYDLQRIPRCPTARAMDCIA